MREIVDGDWVQEFFHRFMNQDQEKNIGGYIPWHKSIPEGNNEDQ